MGRLITYAYADDENLLKVVAQLKEKHGADRTKVEICEINTPERWQVRIIERF